MVESIVSFLESMGIPKAMEQVKFLADPSNIPFAIWETLYAPMLAAVFAYLIGLPVLRLKSDYLAIATLGFAEIIRAIFQWQKLGPITNGSNMLRLF